MFGVIFIVIGVVILLEAFGYLGAISAAVVWGIAFIVIGLAITVRHSARRERRAEWMAKRRERRSVHGEDKDAASSG